MWGLRRGPLAHACAAIGAPGPSVASRSLAAPSAHLHDLRGLGTGFSYFLTMTSWVRFVISWARKGKAPCGCVTEGEHCPAGTGFPLV